MYYTFSTIAQVLAAFLTLSMIFTAIRFDDVRKLQISNVSYLYEGMKNIPEISSEMEVIKRAIESGSSYALKGIRIMLIHPSVIKWSKSNQEHYNSLLNFMQINEGLNDKDDYIFKDVKRSIVIGVIIIPTSLTLNAFVDILKDNKCLSVILITFCLLGTFISIMFMIRSIFKSLHN